MQQGDNRIELDQLVGHLEEMWGHLADLFDDLEASNGWDQPHGPDWTFGDVPYHLAYCNRDVVAHGIELGADYPEAAQSLLATPDALAAWNEAKFAERPAGQTAGKSVAQWRESCERIRRLTEKMDDADLARRAFQPIMEGWATVRACRNHDWSEFMQLRIHMGRDEPVPSPEITRNYLGTMLGFFPMMLNTEAATGQDFTVVMDFGDPEVGAWTIQVENGTASVRQGAADNPDMIMTQSAETFEKTFRRIHDPVEAIQSGQVQVSDFQALSTFGQLFPM